MRLSRGVVLLASLAFLVGCGDETSPAPLPPIVAITSPPAGPVTGTVTLAASLRSPTTTVVVTWKINTALLPAPDSTAPFEHLWDTALNGPGIYEWIAVAEDNSGTVTESEPVRYTVSP